MMEKGEKVLRGTFAHGTVSQPYIIAT